MNGINTGKLIAGGLVAGLVLNAIDVATGWLLLADDYSMNMERLGLDPAMMESPAGMATWIVIDFIIGFILLWTYAAIRPRFGPGPGTAARAALVPFLAVSAVLFGFATGGMLDQALYWKSTVIALVNVLLASLAGAAVYKE
jgi:hypothetical protein